MNSPMVYDEMFDNCSVCETGPDYHIYAAQFDVTWR